MKKALKFLGSLAFCNLYRILRIFPNNDPIMGCALPLSRKGKWWHSVLFAMIAMVSFDLITARVGIWTIGTALTYGLVAALAWKYFKAKKSVGLKTYAKTSVGGVLLFDFLTGPVMSSFAFRIPFAAAFIGQIPFTMMHLASATALTLVIVPVLDPQLRAELQDCTTRYLSRLRLFLSRPILG